MPLTLHVTGEQLITVISEVASFAEWFNVEIESRVYARKRPTTHTLEC